jgi:hypothetical protein
MNTAFVKFVRVGVFATLGLVVLCGSAMAKPSNKLKARDDVASIVQGKRVTIPVLKNDSTPSSGVRLSIVRKPRKGRVEVYQGKYLRYKAWRRHSGQDRIVYRIRDSKGRVSQAVVRVNVLKRDGASAKPTLKAKPDVATLESGQEIVLDVTQNDRGAISRLELVEKPAQGKARVVGRNRIRYRAPRGFSGQTSLVYRIRDRYGNQASTTMTINVTCARCKPVATSPKVILSWKPPHTPVDAYRIYFDHTPQAESLLLEVSVLQGDVDAGNPQVLFEAHKDLGASAGDKVCFRVRSVAGDAVSDFSEPICRVI